MSMRIRQSISRRRFLKTSAGAGIAAAGGIARPMVSRAAERPALSHGVQSGDVSVDSAVVWARADRPSRALIDWSTTESFKNSHRAAYVDALPETDLTANVLIEGLPASQDIFYRVQLQDLASPTIIGEPMIGRFRTAPADRRSISFAWSGDTAGQGWGIDESRGGMRLYGTMLRNRPDFFIHSGDNIYADGPIPAAWFHRGACRRGFRRCPSLGRRCLPTRRTRSTADPQAQCGTVRSLARPGR